MSEEVKQGRPWKTAGRFDSYEKADAKRKELSKTVHEVKVKRLSDDNDKRFIVKTRDIENEKPSKKTKSAKK